MRLDISRGLAAACLILLCVCLRGHAAGSRLTAYFFGNDTSAEIEFETTADAASARNTTASTIGADGGTRPLEAIAVESLGGRPRMVRVFLLGRPPADHLRMRVCFEQISLGGSVQRNRCQEGSIERDASAAKRQALAKLAATATTQREKDLFVSGFFSGSSGQAAAAIDLSVNRGDLKAKGIEYFLRIKRSSGSTADPRNAEAGVQWRKPFLARRPAIAPGTARTPWIAGYLLDAGAKVEGDAATRAVNHALCYTSFGIQSATKSLGGQGNWARFRIKAAGVEAAAGKARILNGAEASVALGRIELNLESANRYLLHSESSVRGLQTWTEASVKLFFREANTLRYGVRLSYQRGALPPFFVSVRALQLGWILESKEGV